MTQIEQGLSVTESPPPPVAMFAKDCESLYLMELSKIQRQGLLPIVKQNPLV